VFLVLLSITGPKQQPKAEPKLSRQSGKDDPHNPGCPKLKLLIRATPQKVFLIVDRHPVHRSKPVAQWLQKHSEQIRLFFLPNYSPQLNPDELLNHDVKTNAVGRAPPKTLKQMMDNLRSYLWSTQRYPHLIQNYFREQHVAYAAA
jgi:transposase